MEKNGKVSWQVFIIIISIAGTILATLWTKLEKIDDSLGEIKIDIAVIKEQIEDKHLMSGETSLLNRMYGK